jgi:hypothetical protein
VEAAELMRPAWAELIGEVVQGEVLHNYDSSVRYPQQHARTMLRTASFGQADFFKIN